MKLFKIIAYAFIAGAVSTFAIFIFGMFVYGYNFADWTEAQSRFVSVLGTIAGVLGVGFGLVMASRAEHRAA